MLWWRRCRLFFSFLYFNFSSHAMIFKKREKKSYVDFSCHALILNCSKCWFGTNVRKIIFPKTTSSFFTTLNAYCLGQASGGLPKCQCRYWVTDNQDQKFRTKLDYRNFLFICIRIFKSPLYISELSTLQECNITSLQILAIWEHCWWKYF